MTDKGESLRGGRANRPRRTFACAYPLAALIAAALCVSHSAIAHPAGLSSVNRYLGVVCEAGGQIRIAYRLDFAELPSVAELDLLDADHDGAVTPDEERSYLERRFAPLVSAWVVKVKEVAATPRIAASSLDILPGEGGLSTVRIAAEVAIERAQPIDPEEAVVDVEVRDSAFSEKGGWREMEAEDTNDAKVLFAPNEPSRGLLLDTSGRNGGVPRVNEAHFMFRLVQGKASPWRAVWPGTKARVDGRIVMKRVIGSWSFFAIAAALALALGGTLVLSPRHGKALACLWALAVGLLLCAAAVSTMALS
jgi:hypothetical protein